MIFAGEIHGFALSGVETAIKRRLAYVYRHR